MMGYRWRGVVAVAFAVLTGGGMAWADAASDCQARTWEALDQAVLPTCLEAAQKGDAYAQNIMGVSQTLEAATAQDAAKAVNWFRKAAVHGFAPAQNNLAAAYATGFGVKQDHAKATDWWRHAAAQGDPDARASLGLSTRSDQNEECNKQLVMHFFYRSGVSHSKNKGSAKSGECGFLIQQLKRSEGYPERADKLKGNINGGE